MSRIGEQPVSVPSDVEVEAKKGLFAAEGPQGRMEQPLHPDMKVEYDEDAGEVRVKRPSNSKRHRALHGLTRKLVDNAVVGVTEGFRRRLEIVGVGYNARAQGDRIALNLGFSEQVVMDVPDGLTVETPSPTEIVITGCDRQKVGQFAAEVRAKRPPEPYKGKGIRYEDEYVRRKAGKAFVGGEQ